ncbi:hypothetical protein EUGRSUZ_E00765 [Eucalyptus grandis]|uniref:Uncharacterized protein n=2 Tax=Eucalyptus grandis TaxID=71139 RepID=A0ACC3KSB8_EUCGR|nr:hypothetical protein EUGRSUZ_E00765 [Eucalyptus grandis]
MTKLVVKVHLRNEKKRRKAMQIVSKFEGIGSLAMDSKDNKLTVSGDFDPVEVVNKLRKSCNTDVVSVESAKKDEGKKNEDQVTNLEAYQTYSPVPITYYYVPCYETPNCVIC